MKILILAITAFCCFYGCTISHWPGPRPFVDEQGREIHSAADIIIEKPERRLPDREVMKFNLKWIGFSIGTVTMSINGIEKINGRDAYYLEALFESNKFLSKIYRIEDRFVSYMDVENLYTLRQEVYRSEGKYRKRAVIDFDQAAHKAHFRDLIAKSEKVIDIPADVQDTLSACYYFMLLPLKAGDTIDYSVYNSEQVYRLMGLISEKAFIKTPGLGLKEAFGIKPYVDLNGQRVQKGELKAYFSCDKRRIPLMGRIKGVVFAEAAFSLTKIE